MIPNRSCSTFDHGQIADLILVPTKVPFANCHCKDYFAHSKNELPRPKEAEQQIPTALFYKVGKLKAPHLRKWNKTIMRPKFKSCKGILL